MYAHTLIDVSGITRCSLHAWKKSRSLFGTFNEVFVGFTGTGHRYLTASPKDDPSSDAARNWDSASLVLRDEVGSELWLDGCKSGYTGEGAAGTGYILHKEGFPAELVDLVPLCGLLHLRRGSESPVTAQFRRKPIEARGNRPAEIRWSQHIQHLIANGYFDDFEEA